MIDEILNKVSDCFGTTFAFNPASYVLLILPPLLVVIPFYNPPICTVQFLGTKAGLRSTFNKPLHKSVIHHILNDPFYYGMMRVNGRLYSHKYQSLISKFLFDKCQEGMQRYHKKPFNYLVNSILKCEKSSNGLRYQNLYEPFL